MSRFAGESLLTKNLTERHVSCGRYLDRMRFLRRSAPPAPEPHRNRCRHITDDVQPVHDVDGRLVASLCTACDQSLPAWKTCKDCGWIEVATFGRNGTWRELMSPCRQHAAD